MKSSTPDISILIPIYNVETYLSQCLESVINQTLSNLEIICINDGSTDKSLSIIQDFAARDSRIVIIDKPNTGYGDSMNTGLKRAQGKYLAIVEPDDWIDTDAFAIMYHLAETHHADLVKTNYYRTTTRHHQVQNQLISEISQLQTINPRNDRFVFRFSPAIWSALYRRQFLIDSDIQFLPTPGASYQDLSFSFKVWLSAKRVVLSPQAFLHYRVDNSSSSIHQSGKVNCVVTEYDEIEDYMRQYHLSNHFAATMCGAKFRNYHWNFQRLNSAQGREFYETWHQSMLRAQQDNLLQKSEFRTREWLTLKLMLKHPKLAYHLLNLRKKLCA